MNHRTRQVARRISGLAAILALACCGEQQLPIALELLAPTEFLVGIDACDESELGGGYGALPSLRGRGTDPFYTAKLRWTAPRRLVTVDKSPCTALSIGAACPDEIDCGPIEAVYIASGFSAFGPLGATVGWEPVAVGEGIESRILLSGAALESGPLIGIMWLDHRRTVDVDDAGCAFLSEAESRAWNRGNCTTWTEDEGSIVLVGSIALELPDPYDEYETVRLCTASDVSISQFALGCYIYE